MSKQLSPKPLKESYSRYVVESRKTPTAPFELVSKPHFAIKRDRNASGSRPIGVLQPVVTKNFVVIVALAIMSLALLGLASGIWHAGEGMSKSIADSVKQRAMSTKTRVQTNYIIKEYVAPVVAEEVVRPIGQLAFCLIVISAVQILCVIVLWGRAQATSFPVQSADVSSALEPLGVSRIIRKRENLTPEELVELLRDMANELHDAKTIERFLIEKASHVVCIIDKNSRIQTVSKACLSAWGYATTEMEGNSICDYLEDGPNVFAQLLSVADTNEKIVIESQLKARDGEILEIVWTAYWSRSDGALFCVAQDITERKRNEKLRREFIAMVTHDLKTPIASLHGILVLLNEGVLGQLNPQGKRLTEKVTRDFDRLLRLINNMLDLERSESGGMRLELASVPLEEIVDHATELIRLQAAAKNIQIKTSVAPLTAWADKDQLVRVVLNLLSNAVKFSPENSMVEVVVEDFGPTACVSVKDCGRGIPKDRTQKIFEKFEQIYASDVKKNGGTGLGLAICKAIVSEHGGEIGVRSEEGNGSQFWFTVPKAANGVSQQAV